MKDCLVFQSSCLTDREMFLNQVVGLILTNGLKPFDYDADMKKI